MQRYFVKKNNNEFVLCDSDFHHIKDVMRIKNKEQIICVCDNQSFLCEISYNQSSYKINVISEITKDVELTKNIILYQALIKNDKFDLVVQKSCELGVSKIVPTIFSRSVIKVDESKIDNKLSRYNKIIKEACEQSTRQILPIMENYINVKKIKLDERTLGLMAYEKNGDYSSLKNALSNVNDYDNIAVVIGPEGGFSQDEVDYLTSIGFHSVSLGKRILRSETASLYALSVIGFELEG